MSEGTQPMERVRYPMRLGAPWLPILALFGGTPSRSFVELTRDFVRIRFGPLFDERVPRETIAHAGPVAWSLLGGIGWRLAAGRTIGLIGSRKDNVELRLREPIRVRFLFFPKRCERIVVSLRDPGRFLEHLGAPTAEGAQQ
jgi:hypothetical protein